MITNERIISRIRENLLLDEKDFSDIQIVKHFRDTQVWVFAELYLAGKDLKDAVVNSIPKKIKNLFKKIKD